MKLSPREFLPALQRVISEMERGCYIQGPAK